MLHRIKKKNDINKDKWIGVGGKIEDGETPRDCVIREAREETGLRLKSPEYRGIIHFESDGNYSEEMHLFTCKDFDGEIIQCDEGELEWVAIPDVEKLAIWEGDRVFLELLRTERRFFEVWLDYDGEKLVGKRVTVGE